MFTLACPFTNGNTRTPLVGPAFGAGVKSSSQPTVASSQVRIGAVLSSALIDPQQERPVGSVTVTV